MEDKENELIALKIIYEEWKRNHRMIYEYKPDPYDYEYDRQFTSLRGYECDSREKVQDLVDRIAGMGKKTPSKRVTKGHDPLYFLSLFGKAVSEGVKEQTRQRELQIQFEYSWSLLIPILELIATLIVLQANPAKLGMMKRMYLLDID